MTKAYTLATLIITLFFASTQSYASDDKELRNQRKAAQKERQEQKKERVSQNREAVKAFKLFAKDKKAEYKEKLADLTTEFQLQEVNLKATHQAKVANAEAEYQKKLMGLFLAPGTQLDKETLENFQNQAKAYNDELFALKKQSADEVHHAWNANEKQKNTLLNEKDQLILKEADNLGLTKDFSPILATKIGGELTPSEEKWNKSEEEDVKKLKQQNLKHLLSYQNGEKLRNLTLQYANDDFKLSWDEKEELQAIDSTVGFYNILLMQQGQNTLDQQAYLDELAENSKKKELIKIKYKKISGQNRILRKKEKKDIQNN